MTAITAVTVGGRGLGKTYGAKKHVIKRFLRYGEQFTYLRRYKTELGAKTSFFADVAEEFPEESFRVDGMRAQVLDKKVSKGDKEVWLTMGYFIDLSNAQSKKSVAYPDVSSALLRHAYQKIAQFDSWNDCMQYVNTIIKSRSEDRA